MHALTLFTTLCTYFFQVCLALSRCVFLPPGEVRKTWSIPMLTWTSLSYEGKMSVLCASHAFQAHSAFLWFVYLWFSQGIKKNYLGSMAFLVFSKGLVPPKTLLVILEVEQEWYYEDAVKKRGREVSVHATREGTRETGQWLYPSIWAPSSPSWSQAV